MKLSSPQHAQNLLFLPIFDEQGRFFFHAACESTFSCSAGAVFLSLRSLDASDCEIGSASVRTLRTLVKPTTSLLGVWAVAGIGSTNSAGNSTGRRFSTARKRCNSNAVTSWFERVATELHAKLVAGPGRAIHSDLAPLVWRAPEGPEGLAAVPVGGGGAWPGFETTRRAKLAARTARGRAAAHGRTKQPGLTKHTRHPEHPCGRKQPSGTGRRHDPRLGRQRTQSRNPQSICDVGGATRPGHSQGGTDEGNDVGGGPAQAS